MAGLNLTPIPAGKGSRTPLADIDPAVAETVEEAFVYCQSNAERLQTDPFPSKDDADAWLSEARAYAYQREAGRIVVSGNAARASKEAGGPVAHVVRFRVEPYVAPAATDSNGTATG